MEEKKNEIISWIKAYKKQLLLAGVSITAVIGVIIGLKNKEAIVNLWDFLTILSEERPAARCFAPKRSKRKGISQRSKGRFLDYELF